MEFKTVPLIIPQDCNVIFGMTHFIKTVEDIHEIMVTAVPGVKFGIAFCEASGACLVRFSGNDTELSDAAVENARNVGAGHTFIVVMKDAYPINVLPQIKACQEVCAIFCATANPVEVIIAETAQGRGVLGVIDGFPPKGVEDINGKEWRSEFLRKIGYKL